MSEPDLSDFPSTHTALRTIFPQASDQEIAMYEKQLDSVENLEPVLIISPNQSWINQHGLPTYHVVMLLPRTVFKIGVEMRIHVVSSILQLSLTSTPQATTFL